MKEYNPKQVEEWCNSLGPEALGKVLEKSAGLGAFWVFRSVVLEKMQELSGNFKLGPPTFVYLRSGHSARYIVNISLMEKKGAGFHTRQIVCVGVGVGREQFCSSSTFWDPESDAATTYRPGHVRQIEICEALRP